jgi:hypothetical protein
MKNKIKVSLCSPPLTPTPTLPLISSGADGPGLSGQLGATRQEGANGGLINTLLQQSASTLHDPFNCRISEVPISFIDLFVHFFAIHLFAMGLFPSAPLRWFRSTISD